LRKTIGRKRQFYPGIPFEKFYKNLHSLKKKISKIIEKACKSENAIYNGAKAVKGRSTPAEAFKRALDGGRG
jgi:hypothetical protein